MKLVGRNAPNAKPSSLRKETSVGYSHPPNPKASSPKPARALIFDTDALDTQKIAFLISNI
jgi:hypothetical protein